MALELYGRWERRRREREEEIDKGCTHRRRK
jgi:hypothetical protein